MRGITSSRRPVRSSSVSSSCGTHQTRQGHKPSRPGHKPSRPPQGPLGTPGLSRGGHSRAPPVTARVAESRVSRGDADPCPTLRHCGPFVGRRAAGPFDSPSPPCTASSDSLSFAPRVPRVSSQPGEQGALRRLCFD